MTILVVDDNPHVLSYLKKALGKIGYTVLVSTSARDALTLISNNSINLIISDVAMPGMDGNEFCRLVRANLQQDYIPIIFLTARSSVDDVATGFISGADDYLTKPIRLDTLIAKIQEYAM